MKTKKIYISGAITGVKNYKKIFKRTEERIKEENPNAVVLNPAEIILPSPCGWDDYMAICMHLLKSADEIHMIPGWENSTGARTEFEYAKTHGIKIKYVDMVNWSKIPVDTPILVRNSENNPWEKRYFAKFVNGEIYAFYRGQTSWSTEEPPIRWDHAKLVDFYQFEEEKEL